MKRIFTLIALIAVLVVPGYAFAPQKVLPKTVGKKLSEIKVPARVLQASGENPIIDTPAGTLHDNMYAKSSAYGLGWGGFYIQEVDGGIGKVVEGTDGNLYIYNPISQGYIWFSRLPWLKLEPVEPEQADEPGTLRFRIHLPQLYVLDNDYPYYAYGMHYDNTEGMPVVDEETEIDFTWKDGVLTQQGDAFIGLCDATADWFYMADQHIEYSPVTDEIITMPEGAYVQSYTMTYLSDPEDLTATKDRIVTVAFDDDYVYIGNLNDNNSDAFIKSGLDHTIPTRQYLGPDPYYNAQVYVLTGDAYVDSETYVSPVFNYNLNENIPYALASGDGDSILTEWPSSLVVNCGPNSLYIISDYVAPVFKPFADVPATPATPIFSNGDLTVNNNTGYTVLHFTIPVVDVDGNRINENKLYYNIYLDDSVFTFTPEQYTGITTPMTDVPYKFEDNINYDIYMSGGRHIVYIYTTQFSAVGVQSIYKVGDEWNRSEIAYVYNPSGINEVGEGAQVVETRYYDLSGRELRHAPAKGFYLQRNTYSNGTTVTQKVVK